ncbi:hypothetical protein ATANTOWER_030077 [Ataeniobius toweri]|uniref:Uncharacterized protein n=1 Tax=Ataeniobius toweri TaxID=208326 RepID=A0ABU7A8Y8_9TELE|nr:hypothetical protein [Ataeniobius toweri]
MSSDRAFAQLGLSSCPLSERLDIRRCGQMYHLVSPVFSQLSQLRQSKLLRGIFWTMPYTHVAVFDSNSGRRTCLDQCLLYYHCESGQIWKVT